MSVLSSQTSCIDVEFEPPICPFALPVNIGGLSVREIDLLNSYYISYQKYCEARSGRPVLSVSSATSSRSGRKRVRKSRRAASSGASSAADSGVGLEKSQISEDSAVMGSYLQLVRSPFRAVLYSKFGDELSFGQLAELDVNLLNDTWRQVSLARVDGNLILAAKGPSLVSAVSALSGVREKQGSLYWACVRLADEVVPKSPSAATMLKSSVSVHEGNLQQGYCYLKLFDVENVFQAYQQCGAWPTTSSVYQLLEDMSFSDNVAHLKIHGKCGRYHVTEQSGYPALDWLENCNSQYDRLGGSVALDPGVLESVAARLHIPNVGPVVPCLAWPFDALPGLLATDELGRVITVVLGHFHAAELVRQSVSTSSHGRVCRTVVPAHRDYSHAMILIPFDKEIWKDNTWVQGPLVLDLCVAQDYAFKLDRYVIGHEYDILYY